MTAAYVYKITRNDDLDYIGITINLKKRISDHLRSERFAVGVKSIEILKECSSYQEAKDLEEFYINEYDTFYNGLNNTIDGKGNHLSEAFTTLGFKFSEQSRKKMSDSAKARGMPRACIEASRSEQSRKKMSEKRKGVRWCPAKIDNSLVEEMMTRFRSNDHPFDNDFIKTCVAKKSRHLVGSVPINELPSPNGKKLNMKSVYCKYYSKQFNVTKNAIAGILENDGKRCKHHSEI